MSQEPQGKIAHGFWYSIIQGPDGMDLPSPTDQVVIAGGETVTILVRLRRDASWIWRSLKLWAREERTKKAWVNALEPYTDRLTFTPYVDGGAGNVALSKPIHYPVYATARPGRGGEYFNYALPARSIVTLEITNNGTDTLVVGGSILGIAVRLKDCR